MHHHHLSPHLYVLFTVITVAGCFALFRSIGYHDEWFFLAIFALSGFWALGFLVRQLRCPGYYHVDRRSTAWALLRRAIVRYLVWLVPLALGLAFYETHNYYRAYDKNTLFMARLFQGYLYVGIPYFWLTLKFKASRREDYYDPAVRLILIAQHLARGVLRGQAATAARAIFRRRYNLKVLLNLIMRCYFIPVMVVQVYVGFRDGISLSAAHAGNYDLWTILVGITTFLWLADALNASAGYALESRWTESRSRSIDLTLGGWLVCLACYAPLNHITGTLFTFAPEMISPQPAALFSSATALYVVKILEVLTLAALVYSDVALGPSGVNITLKKLQTRGPYGIVRHPATVCKLTLWWMQVLFYIDFSALPALVIAQAIIGQLAWNAIYILRALSEERHLKQFPEYREYMQKVRYRFIPGVV